MVASPKLVALGCSLLLWLAHAATPSSANHQNLLAHHNDDNDDDDDIDHVMVEFIDAPPELVDDAAERAPEDATKSRQLQTRDVLDLLNFNVRIKITENVGIQSYRVSDVVTEWMNASFREQLLKLGYVGPYARFDTVILLERDERQRRSLRRASRGARDGDPDRALQTTGVDVFDDDRVYVGLFKGAALFTRLDGQKSVPEGDVQAMQKIAVLDERGLRIALQASGAVGLGDYVLSAAANLVAVEDPEKTDENGDANSNNNNNNNTNSAEDAQLEIVIIVTIVVAGIAFLLLIFVVCWAWRYDRRNREAYMVGKQPHNANARSHKTPDNTASTTMEDAVASPGARTAGLDSQSPGSAPNKILMGGTMIRDTPPSEIGGGSDDGDYPESVISEDVSTSLSLYYRSGMGGAVAAGEYHQDNKAEQNHYDTNSGINQLNDNASFYSMESYGFSLDGYAPSVATAQPSDGAPQIKTSSLMTASSSSAARANATAAQIKASRAATSIGGLPIAPAADLEENSVTEEELQAAVRDIISRPTQGELYLGKEDPPEDHDPADFDDDGGEEEEVSLPQSADGESSRDDSQPFQSYLPQSARTTRNVQRFNPVATPASPRTKNFHHMPSVSAHAAHDAGHGSFTDEDDAETLISQSNHTYQADDDDETLVSMLQDDGTLVSMPH